MSSNILEKHALVVFDRLGDLISMYGCLYRSFSYQINFNSFDSLELVF